MKAGGERNWEFPRHRHFERNIRRVASDWFNEKGYPVSKRIVYI